MIRRWFILGILASVMVILLWNFYNEALMYDPIAAVRAGENTGEPDKLKLSLFKPAWGREIVQKNLFSPERRYQPPAPRVAAPVDVAPVIPPPPPPPPQPKMPALKLKGIILNQYGEYVALVEKDKARPVQMRKGDRVDDIVVIDVKERSVSLMWREEEILLSMEMIKSLAR